MELEHSEIIALMDYHRTEQYRTAGNEEYCTADYHKRRADDWSVLSKKNEKFVVTEVVSIRVGKIIEET